MLVCNIGAGWGTAQMNLSQSGTVVTSMQLPPNVEHDPVFGHRYDPPATTEVLCNLPQFPQRLVVVSEEWASYLNPTILDLNTTVVDTLMSSPMIIEEDKPKRLTAEVVLSALMANGLARSAFTGQIQGTVKTKLNKSNNVWSFDSDTWATGKGDVFIVDPNESHNWAKFHVESSVESYRYSSRGRLPKFAITVLLIYCLMAILHIVYAGTSGISSTSWDSIGEVIALAMNSTPTTKLRNTCAGITDPFIYKLPVRIMTRQDAEGEGEHLELVFDDVDEEEAVSNSIKANRVYGTLPASLLKRH